jgi:hypothetical protein
MIDRYLNATETKQHVMVEPVHKLERKMVWVFQRGEIEFFPRYLQTDLLRSDLGTKGPEKSSGSIR